MSNRIRLAFLTCVALIAFYSVMYDLLIVIGLADWAKNVGPILFGVVRALANMRIF